MYHAYRNCCPWQVQVQTRTVADCLPNNHGMLIDIESHSVCEMLFTAPAWSCIVQMTWRIGERSRRGEAVRHGRRIVSGNRDKPPGPVGLVMGRVYQPCSWQMMHSLLFSALGSGLVATPFIRSTCLRTRPFILTSSFALSCMLSSFDLVASSSSSLLLSWLGPRYHALY